MLKRSRKAEPEPARREPFTYVHRSTTIVGELHADGRVRIHGTVRGNIKVRGVLEIAESGVVEGELIEADEVKILGKVKASISASGKVELWKDGRLIGNVRAAALDIEEGAFFTGHSEMLAEDGSVMTPTLPGHVLPGRPETKVDAADLADLPETPRRRASSVTDRPSAEQVAEQASVDG